MEDVFIAWIILGCLLVAFGLCFLCCCTHYMYMHRNDHKIAVEQYETLKQAIQQEPIVDGMGSLIGGETYDVSAKYSRNVRFDCKFQLEARNSEEGAQIQDIVLVGDNVIDRSGDSRKYPEREFTIKGTACHMNGRIIFHKSYRGNYDIIHQGTIYRTETAGVSTPGVFLIRGTCQDIGRDTDIQPFEFILTARPRPVSLANITRNDNKRQSPIKLVDIIVHA